MDHRRLPDLLVELLNSPWQIEIVRVHQGPPNQTLRSQPRGSYLLAGNNAGGDGDDDAGGADEGGGADDSVDAVDEDEADTDDGTGDADVGDGDGGGESYYNQARERTRSSAPENPNMATVVVAGLMTIYNPPKIDEQAAGAGSATAPTASANAPNSALTPPEATSGNVATPGQPPASNGSQPAVSNPIQQPSTKD